MSSAERRPAYLGLVPARKGSKGIAAKNLQALGGKPLVQHTLEAALGAQRLTRCVLSSDDETVLGIGARLGRLVLLRRPPHLATDEATTVDVIRHALDWERETNGIAPRNVVLLQPTSPFRTAADVDAAIAAFEAGGRESLMSVCAVSQHPAECVTVGDDGTLRMLSVPRVSDQAGRQSYSKFFFIDGAIYICATDKFLRSGVLFDQGTQLFVLPKSHSIDIDDVFELSVARAMHLYAQSQDPALFTY